MEVHVWLCRHLSAWLGVGEALADVSVSQPLSLLSTHFTPPFTILFRTAPYPQYSCPPLPLPQKEQGKTLKEMYKKWPYFNTNLDLVDMILAKAEVDIAENYDRLLVSDPDQAKLGARLREQLKQTTKAVGPQDTRRNRHGMRGRRI